MQHWYFRHSIGRWETKGAGAGFCHRAARLQAHIQVPSVAQSATLHQERTLRRSFGIRAKIKNLKRTKPDSLTVADKLRLSNADKMASVIGLAPIRPDLKGRLRELLCIHGRKVVPEVGSAPTSPPLQGGANLPQLLGGKWPAEPKLGERRLEPLVGLAPTNTSLRNSPCSC